jgi:hypothetical protein|tara:strand:- start:584 stop:799 length:216 start_codon:yes stop_codon:yes gene_type:complete
MSKFLFNSYAYIDANGYNDDDCLSMVSFYDDKVLIIDTFNQSTIKTMSYSEFIKKYPAITMYDIDDEKKEV